MNGIKQLSMCLLILLLLDGLGSQVKEPSTTNQLIEDILEEEQFQEAAEPIVTEKIVIEESKSEKKAPFEGVDIGVLTINRVVLSPGVDPRTTVRVTFNLVTSFNKVEVVVVDSMGHEVGVYEAEETSIKVNEEQETLYVYKTEINNLIADQLYSYAIRVDHDYSEVMSFKTLSEGGTELAFFGDIQGYKLSQYEAFETVFRAAKEKMPSLELGYLAGDVVDYGESFEQWQYLESASSETFQSHMFLSAIGNHDVYGSPEIYTHTFNYPKNGPVGLEERCYYIDVPYGRIASIDTESYLLYEEQVTWLEEVMSEVEGHRIVLMHRSVYPMSYDEAHVRTFSDVFDALEIDLVLSGHDHVYSRTTMKEDEKVALGLGTTYMIGGSGSGSKFYYNKKEGHRYWEELVYDEDYPVYSLLQIEEEEIVIAVYALKEGESELVDFFRLSE